VNDAKLVQDQDDSWMLFIQHDSGITQPISLGRLSKEQAQREAVRMVPEDMRIICLDKHVTKAAREGRLREIRGIE
jgi:hypothetical protein